MVAKGNDGASKRQACSWSKAVTVMCLAAAMATACETPQGEISKTRSSAFGAVMGAAAGAALGAAVDSHHRGRGAAIGALAGALAGGTTGYLYASHKVKQRVIATSEEYSIRQQNASVSQNADTNERQIAQDNRSVSGPAAGEAVKIESVNLQPGQVHPGDSVSVQTTYVALGGEEEKPKGSINLVHDNDVLQSTDMELDSNGEVEVEHRLALSSEMPNGDYKVLVTVCQGDEQTTRSVPLQVL